MSGPVSGNRRLPWPTTRLGALAALVDDLGLERVSVDRTTVVVRGSRAT